MSIIKIFYPDYYPSVSSECTRFPTLHVSSICQFPGTMIEILHQIAKEANLTIQPFTALDFGYKLNELDDIGPVLYELLENGTIDLIAQPLQWTKKRAERFAFTETIYQAQNRVIRREKRNQYEEIWAFFNTYDNLTWMAIVLAWLLQLAFCLITQWCESKMDLQKMPNIAKSAFQILRIQLLQPDFEQVQFKTKAGKFSLFFFSLVQCSILLGIFSCFVLSNIIHSTDRQKHDSIHTVIGELKSGTHFITGTNPQKWIFEVINTTNDFPFLEIHEAMVNNPMRVRPNIDEVIKLVVEEGGVLFNQDDDRSYFKSMEHCGLVSMSGEMPKVRVHLMFKNESKYLKPINRAILANQILFNRIILKYFGRSQAQIHCKSKTGYGPLKLIPYTGLLLVCLTIIIAAIIVFLFEVLSKFG